MLRVKVIILIANSESKLPYSMVLKMHLQTLWWQQSSIHVKVLIIINLLSWQNKASGKLTKYLKEGGGINGDKNYQKSVKLNNFLAIVLGSKFFFAKHIGLANFWGGQQKYCLH